MATAESVKTKLQGLLAQANAATGKADADLTVAVSSLIAGYGSGGGDQVEKGSFVADSTAYINIPCSFEPDVIVITREQAINTGGDVRGITEIRIIKDWLTTGRYIAANGATTGTDGQREFAPSGYGSVGLSYADGAISGKPNVAGRILQNRYTYNYIFGRCGL